MAVAGPAELLAVLVALDALSSVCAASLRTLAPLRTSATSVAVAPQLFTAVSGNFLMQQTREESLGRQSFTADWAR